MSKDYIEDPTLPKLGDPVKSDPKWDELIKKGVHPRTACNILMVEYLMGKTSNEMEENIINEIT